MNNDTARCPGMNVMKSGISHCAVNFSIAPGTVVTAFLRCK